MNNQPSSNERPRYLEIPVTELCEVAVGAARNADAAALISITDAFEQRWGYAVAHQRHDDMEALLDCLLNATDQARAILHGKIDTIAVQPYLIMWETMFRLGRVLRSMDDSGRAELEELRQKNIPHGELLLIWLQDRPTRRVAEITAVSDLPHEQCLGALDQLRNAGFVAQIGFEWFALTGKGTTALKAKANEGGLVQT